MGTLDSRIVLNVPLGQKAGGTWSAVQNGAAYAAAPFDMEIDHIDLGITMGGGKNSAGSGNFEIVASHEGVAMWAADGLQIAYSSVHPYATIARANLLVKSLRAGKEIRLDVTEVFGGAATVYPDAAVVTFVGVAY